MRLADTDVITGGGTPGTCCSSSRRSIGVYCRPALVSWHRPCHLASTDRYFTISPRAPPRPFVSLACWIKGIQACRNLGCRFQVLAVPAGKAFSPVQWTLLWGAPIHAITPLSCLHQNILQQATSDKRATGTMGPGAWVFRPSLTRPAGADAHRADR